MAEEKKEPWLNYLALTTIIFAVAATLSTFKGGGYSTKSMISQEQASNKWSYYQSKSLKLYLYETQKDVLEKMVRLLEPTRPRFWNMKNPLNVMTWKKGILRKMRSIWSRCVMKPKNIRRHLEWRLYSFKSQY